MNYEVRQLTRYTYASPVPFSRHLARLLPASRPGQLVRSARLDIDPAPSERRETYDFFGNRVTHFALDRSHDRLEVRLVADIEVTEGDPLFAELTPTVGAVRAAAIASGDLGSCSPIHALFSSPRVGLTEAVTAYAGESLADDRPILEAATELMERIRNDFDYVPGATDVTTPPEEAFAARKGVCQDFAHVMIAGLRGLTLPARYVSGYLRTEPPPGQPRLEGADATHAWVEVWCGASVGWVGFDPTNAILAGEDHVTLAIGRDYGDVAPLDGVIVGYGAQDLEVEVDVIPRGRGGTAS